MIHYISLGGIIMFGDSSITCLKKSRVLQSILIGASALIVGSTTVNAAQLQPEVTKAPQIQTVSLNTAPTNDKFAVKTAAIKSPAKTVKQSVKQGWHGHKYYKNGKFLTGRQTINGKTYLFGKDGRPKKGLQTVGKQKQFYNVDFTQRKNAYAKLGKQGVYYFNGKGNAVSGVRKFKDRQGKVQVEVYHQKTKKQLRNTTYTVNKSTKYVIGKTGKAVLKKTEPTKKGALYNAPYIKNGKPNGRPKLTGKKRLAFEQAVYNRQIRNSPDGKLRDPNPPREILYWKPGQPRTGKVDFGHKKHHEYNKWFLKYKNREITLAQFKQHEFNPDNFYIESISKNRSKRFEAK